jgi:hypothetical protein
MFGQWLSALQVGIVDARQLADVKILVRLEPHQIRTIDSWMPSKPIPTFHVLKPFAIRRASEMNALNSLKAGSARFDALTDLL